MRKLPAKSDSRLSGTWKSDRRRTFRHFRPKAGSTPQGLRKLKSIFGKLVIVWGRGVFRTELDGQRLSGPYEVVASDAVSVVVRCWDELTKTDRLQHIHFDGDYYWVTLAGGGLCEYFRKVPRRGAGPGERPVSAGR